MEISEGNAPLITNDAVVFGLLMITLAAVFITSSSSKPFWKKFYTYIPSLLLCYFIPSLYNSFGLISGEESDLYFMASRYLLPASLVLLTLSIDLPGLKKLGGKAIIMFLAGTVGIILGGPISLFIMSLIAPEIVGGVGPDAVWRGMTTIAGSWIGGSANQAAMLQVFGASTALFSIMVTIDVIVGNFWTAFLLYGAGRSEKLDKVFKADASSIDEVRKRIENYRLSIERNPTLPDIMVILGIGFGATSLSHLAAGFITPWIENNAPWLEQFSLTSAFFWIVVIATTLGLLLSFTRAKKLEGAGASRLGSVMIYVLVATIGMQMDVTQIWDNIGLFLMGIIWMMVHVSILFLVAKIINAPFFFIAVGSQANVGGAASAPVVAAAFHPSLASVGVLLAVLGYALGTYGALISGYMMQAIAP